MILSFIPLTSKFWSKFWISSTWSADFCNSLMVSFILLLFACSYTLLVYFVFIIRFSSSRFWIRACFSSSYFLSSSIRLDRFYFTLVNYLSLTYWASCSYLEFYVIKFFNSLNYFFNCFTYSLSAKLDVLVGELDFVYTISLRVENVFWVDNLKLLSYCAVALCIFYKSISFRWKEGNAFMKESIILKFWLSIENYTEISPSVWRF